MVGTRYIEIDIVLNTVNTLSIKYNNDNMT